MKSTVTNIGANAISPNEQVMILFGDKEITENLQKVSVAQKFTTPRQGFQISDEILIDGEKFEVEYKGKLVDQNFEELGHITLFFSEVPDTPQHNAIYLTPHRMPQVHVGSIIEYC